MSAATSCTLIDASKLRWEPSGRVITGMSTPYPVAAVTRGRVRRREVCQSEAEMQCAKLRDESDGTLTTKRLSDRR